MGTKILYNFKGIQASVEQYQKLALYATLLFVSIIWFLIAAALRHSKPTAPRTGSLNLEIPGSKSKTSFKSPKRPPGIWTPIDFKRPAAAPYPNWDVHKTEPKPYRPFKYGPYHITMGLRTMNWDEWIELDNQFLEWHAIKAQRIQDRGDKCCRTAPEAYNSAIELLEELFSYLPQRYPTLYIPLPSGIQNLHTKESFSLPPTEDPMIVAARLIQDDIALMLQRPDGKYYLLAGSILLPGFWRLSDKFGMPLSEIHTSGHVPAYRPKLEKGMENFFRRTMPHQPVVRHNYFIQVDDNLAWSHSIGPEDPPSSSSSSSPPTTTTTSLSPSNSSSSSNALSPAAAAQEEESHQGWTRAPPSTIVDAHHLRTERQTLRRLPRSGAVVFTIRTYFEPVTRIATGEIGVARRLASAVRSWGEETARYKGRDKYARVLLDYLDRVAREEGEAGQEEGDSYPF